MELKRLRAERETLVAHMRTVGYSEGYVRQMEVTIARLIEAAPSLGGWDDTREWAAKWSRERSRPYMLTHLEIIRQFDESAVLPRTPEAVRHARVGARDTLCGGFEAVLGAYESSRAAARKKPTTVRGEVSNAACFLSRIEALGRTSLAEVTEDDVLSVLTEPDGLPAYSNSHAKQVRAVLRGAGDEGVEGALELMALIPVPRRWRKLQHALAKEEVDALKGVLEDPESGLRQRDRAIVSTLLYTGMRPSDVAALRLSDIDWDRDVIGIVQQKTGSPLELPLVAQVGNAIFDYVTGERGRSDDPHVFLSDEHPHGGLVPISVNNVVNLVFDAAGIRGCEGDRRGARLFRATMATEMIGNGTDRAVAASVLGHESPTTTDGYMSASAEGLRAHASLDVSRFPMGEGVLSRA